MVAVNRTFLAFSLASLSLADAAVVPSPPASPSKPGPQPSSLPSIVPLPMKRMVRERANSTPKKSRFLKSRVEEVTTPLGAAFSKRQQDQARFDVHNVPRQVEEREDKGQGHVDITSPTADGNSTRIASLLYNSTTDNLDASPAQYSTMYMVSNDPHAAQDSMPVTLQMPITNSTDGTTSSYCATFDPSPPAPEPLTMTPFTNSTAPTPHKSQTFVYNASSSVVQPMWNGTDSSGSINQRADEQDVTLVWMQDGALAKQEASASSSSASFAASSSSTTSASSSTATSSTSASFPSKPSVPILPPVLQGSAPASATSSSASILATSSFAASSSQASSSSAATPGAFEVHLASSSTGSTSASSTNTSASSSTADAASIAGEIAQSSSSTSSLDAGPTVAPATEQAIYVAARVSGEDMTSPEWKREL